MMTGRRRPSRTSRRKVTRNSSHLERQRWGNENKMNKRGKGLASALFFIVFLCVIVIRGVHYYRKVEQLMLSNDETIYCNNEIYNGAHYAQLLLDARAGDTNRVIHQLEQFADSSLLLASGYTNVTMRVIPNNAPWAQFKRDRDEHPRQKTWPVKEKHINDMLETLLKDQPQPTNALYSQPATQVEKQ